MIRSIDHSIWYKWIMLKHKHLTLAFKIKHYKISTGENNKFKSNFNIKTIKFCLRLLYLVKDLRYLRHQVLLKGINLMSHPLRWESRSILMIIVIESLKFLNFLDKISSLYQRNLKLIITRVMFYNQWIQYNQVSSLNSIIF